MTDSPGRVDLPSYLSGELEMNSLLLKIVHTLEKIFYCHTKKC